MRVLCPYFSQLYVLLILLCSTCGRAFAVEVRGRTGIRGQGPLLVDFLVGVFECAATTTEEKQRLETREETR